LLRVRGFVLGREGEEAKEFVEFLVLCGKPRTLSLGERERERNRARKLKDFCFSSW
jgi:hypothetical protein